MMYRSITSHKIDVDRAVYKSMERRGHTEKAQINPEEILEKPLSSFSCVCVCVSVCAVLCIGEFPRPFSVEIRKGDVTKKV